MNDKDKKKHGGGPKTPEGKARSARNALRHGLTGNSVVLPSEDPAKFQLLLEDHVREFDPDNTTQMDLVHEISVCRWRIMRILTMEAVMFEINMARTERAANAEFKNPDPDTRMTLAYMHMCENGKSFSNLRRYETAITRRSHQLIGELKALKKDFPASEPPTIPDDSVPPQICETNSKPENCETNSPAVEPPAPEKCETNSPATDGETNSPSAGPEPDDCETNSPAPAASENCETNSAPPKPYIMRRIQIPLDPKTGYPRRYIDVPVDPDTGLVPCP